MLAKRFTKTKLVAIILVALFSSNVFAKPLGSQAEEFNRVVKFIKNLAVGIESENTGLKECCIYFAGYYGYKELGDVLVKQLKKEQNPDTRVLILLSLYRIGDKESIEAAKQLVKYDNGQLLKGMFSIN
jgi:hypothetical protein